jgi:perosamine synthetase
MLAEQVRESVKAVLEELANSEAYRTYTGNYSYELMQSIAAYLDGSTALLASSGTAALEIALRAAGIGEGDEVILSAYDYPGNFWAIERCLAKPMLIDTEPNSWRIEPMALDGAIGMGGGAVKAIVVSHLHGQLQPMRELREWCDETELLLVEDNCQGIGAEIAGAPSGTFGHICIGSFGGGKVLSAGRGGFLATKSEPLMQRARIASGAGSGPYMMSELQAAVVLAQWVWLPSITQLCREFFGEVSEILRAEGCEHLFPAETSLETTAFYQAGWLTPAQPMVGVGSASAQRDEMLVKLQHGGIACGAGFSGFHRRSNRRCRVVGELANAANVADRTWVVHHSQALTGRFSTSEVAGKILAATSTL